MPSTPPSVLVLSPVISAEHLVVAERPVAQFQSFEHEFRADLEMEGSLVHESNCEVDPSSMEWLTQSTFLPRISSYLRRNLSCRSRIVRSVLSSCLAVKGVTGVLPTHTTLDFFFFAITEGFRFERP